MPVIALDYDASGALIGAKQFKTATSSVVSATGKVDKAGTSSQGMFKQWGKEAKLMATNLAALAATGVAVLGAAFVALGIKSIGMASDMEETQAKFDVVFKGMEDSAESWATVLNDSYAMSQEQSKRFLSSIQDLLVPMGMAQDAAGKMSFEVTKLAADLGSFNNVDTATVMQDIQSALVGNFETMKKYGVVLNETVTKENAYTTGLAERGVALTAAQKAQSAYDLILKGSAAAIGDVARNTDTYAFQLRELKKNFADITVSIGQVFLPVATELLTTINAWVSNQDNLNKVLSGTVEVVRFVYNGFMGLKLAAEGVVLAFAGIVKGATKLAKGLKPFEDLLMDLGLIDDSIIDIADSFSDDFYNSAKEAVDKTIYDIERMNNKLDDVSDKVKDIGFEALQKEGEKMAVSVSDRIEQSLIPTLNQLGDTAEGAAQRVSQSTRIMVDGMAVYFDATNTAREGLMSFDGVVQSSTESVRKDNEVKSEAKQSADNLTQSNYDLANSYNSIAGAAGGASAAVKDIAGASGAAAGGSRATGSTEFPEWFTPSMMQEWNKEYMDYLTNQDYISDFHAPGSGLKRDAYSSSGGPSGPGDPSAWASKRGYSPTTEINVNVTTPINSNELAMLVSDLERVEARQ